MRQSKFTETKIVSILKEADAGRLVNKICARTASARPTTISGRPKKLEPDNSKLKRVYVDMALENAAMKDVLAKKTLTPTERREVVTTRSLRVAFRFSGRVRPSD